MKMIVELNEYREPEANNPCEVEIYLDKDALVDLIKDLSKLLKSGDHLHLMTPSWGMHQLSETKVNEKNILIHHVKFSLL